jgi:endothelin-converting enzyme
MGETSTSQAPVDEVDERAPLLGSSESEPSEPEAPAKRAGKWVARNAVLIFVSLLVLAVIIILCIFFASRLPVYWHQLGSTKLDLQNNR